MFFGISDIRNSSFRFHAFFSCDMPFFGCTEFSVTYGACLVGFLACYIFRSSSFGIAALPFPFSQKSRLCILLLIISHQSLLLAVLSSSQFTSTPVSLASLLQYWAVLRDFSCFWEFALVQGAIQGLLSPLLCRLASVEHVQFFGDFFPFPIFRLTDLI